ncbi:hypothetical protein BZG02_09085 [Labilibaculum filiforme]|uniref:DUF4271 domain-containing protein n=1 Tax=Labilibaculum filiforme TaxID=1940526 RepID=A0A2N3HZS0_9BACT|nr:DUF4271 domain-containing protein [Labilibaculum filiforme]PKQ63517.1 hypothetical protein BZG02_09085 [Labilibaculum filiforme]
MAQINSHLLLVNQIPLIDSLKLSNNELKDSLTFHYAQQTGPTQVGPKAEGKQRSLTVFQMDSLLVSDSIPIIEIKPTIQIIRENGIPIASRNSDWMVGILLFALILMAIVRFSFSKFLLRVFDSTINYQTSSNLLLEKNMRNLRGSIFLNLLFYVNFALFVVQYFIYILSLNREYNNILIFLYCFAGLVTLYNTKYLFIRFVGYVFNGIKESKEYLHTVSIYNKNLGVILLPITISAPFIAQHSVPILLNTGLVLCLIFYVFRLFRGFKILFRQHVAIFYMILYLCALEILPLLMIYKLLYLLV